MRLHWAIAVAVVCLVVAVAAVVYVGEQSEDSTSAAAEQQRPTERVTPAPEVNANAVVWRTPEPPTAPQAGDVWIDPRDSKEMVYVAAGKFLRGSRGAGKLLRGYREARKLVTGYREGYGMLPDDDEAPRRRVYVDGFWIDKCEVTVAEYREFCVATGRSMPSAPSWGWQDYHPVELESWEDAAAYAAWAGKRLPTEAEWEKAARGTDGRGYPWGNEWPDGSLCNIYANLDGHKYTAPVGSFPAGASPYGCLDMVGNAWEWCADWYDDRYYARAPDRNPKGPKSGHLRVMRGGSWNTASMSVRCANRSYDTWTVPWEFYGLRCARDAE